MNLTLGASCERFDWKLGRRKWFQVFLAGKARADESWFEGENNLKGRQTLLWWDLQKSGLWRSGQGRERETAGCVQSVYSLSWQQQKARQERKQEARSEWSEGRGLFYRTFSQWTQDNNSRISLGSPLVHIRAVSRPDWNYYVVKFNCVSTNVSVISP